MIPRQGGYSWEKNNHTLGVDVLSTSEVMQCHILMSLSWCAGHGLTLGTLPLFSVFAVASTPTPGALADQANQNNSFNLNEYSLSGAILIKSYLCFPWEMKE